MKYVGISLNFWGLGNYSRINTNVRLSYLVCCFVVKCALGEAWMVYVAKEIELRLHP